MSLTNNTYIQLTETPDKEPETCAMCMEEPDYNCTKLSCGHSFHLNCMMHWWSTQFKTQDGISSCPLCRFKPSREELQALCLCAGARKYMKKMSRGEEPLRRWIDKIRREQSNFRMEDFVSAPEYVPSGA